jgi:PAS domain S-box-containing protein
MLRKIISYKYLRKSFYTHKVISVIILLFSIFIAIFIWSLSKDYHDNLIQEHFEINVHETLSSIEKRISKYENALWGGIALFHASNHVNREEWHHYIEALHHEKNYPGVQGIGFSVMLSPEEVTPFVENVRTNDYATFTLTPAGKREQYSTILYLEPMDKRNQQAIGYDMFSNPVRRKAMEKARDTGRPSVSGKVTLVQEIDSDVQSGFLMYLPLYKSIKEPKTLQARRNSLLGFVYSPFRMNDLMNVLIKDSSMLNFEIYDHEEPSKEHLLYSSIKSSSYTPQHHCRETFQVGGRQWYIHFSSTPKFDTNINNSYPLFLTLGGLLVYFSLLFIIIALFYNREKLRDKTQELKSKTTWLKTLLESSIDGIHLMDRDGKLIESSPSFLKMLGYSNEEARHLNIQDWDAKFSREEILERLQSISDRPMTIETIHRRKDGTPLDVEITTKSIILSGEKYIYASSRDITKRKKMNMS